MKLNLTHIAIASVAWLSGCASQSSDKINIQLYAFDCGNIESRDVSMFSPGVDKGKIKKLTNSCYLIRHPLGDLMWDTGLPDTIGPEGIIVYEGAFEMKVNNPLAKQLKEIDVDPSDIEWLGISHFHSDHTGNANWFSNASLLIQEEEFAAAFGENPYQFGFEPTHYNKLDQAKITKLNGDLDLFGDGRVVIKKAVGHTPGHQALFVDLPNSGPILISGDLYHFTSNREHRRVPVFNFDKEQSLQSMEEIEAFVKQTNAQFWIQHDKEQNATIKHAPEFYN